jgi:hypothetical protein
MFMKPIVGWISGVHLDDLGKVAPKVVDGRTGKVLTDTSRSDWASLVPARGETVDTARSEVYDRLAQWVVRQLEEPW